MTEHSQMATLRGLSRQAIVLVVVAAFAGHHLFAEAFSVQTTAANVENTVNELLSQVPDYSPPTDDDFFRSFRASVPCKVQYFLRDSGVARFLVDTMTWITAPPAILEKYPTTLSRFLHLSGLQGSLLSKLVMRQLNSGTSEDLGPPVTFQRLKYGKHRKQVIDLIQYKVNGNMAEQKLSSNRLVLFVHGGAWGR